MGAQGLGTICKVYSLIIKNWIDWGFAFFACYISWLPPRFNSTHLFWHVACIILIFIYIVNWAKHMFKTKNMFIKIDESLGHNNDKLTNIYIYALYTVWFNTVSNKPRIVSEAWFKFALPIPCLFLNLLTYLIYIQNGSELFQNFTAVPFKYYSERFRTFPNHKKPRTIWNYLIGTRTVPTGSELFIKSSVNIVQNGSAWFRAISANNPPMGRICGKWM